MEHQVGRSGGQIFVDALRRQGVDTVFCVPGESYLEVLDALHDTADKIRVVTCRHEAGAGHMAEAYGKLTGRVGVCMVTRGPGACHASIAVHCASQNSTPMLLVIGQVAREQISREAFQEVDYRQMFGGMTKLVEEIHYPGLIPEIVSRAFHIATSGRPGPVVISLPEDMLHDRANVEDVDRYDVVHPSPSLRTMAELDALLKGAERPVMLLGGSGWTSPGRRDIRRFAELQNLPVCCSFRRQDIFDNEHPNYIGHLTAGANADLVKRVKESDLLLVVGARLDEITTQRYTLLNIPTPHQSLVHVHASEEVLWRSYRPTLSIQAGVTEFAAAAMELVASGRPKNGWREDARAKYESSLQPRPYEGLLDLGKILIWLRENLRSDFIVTLDAGNFSAWPMRFLQWTGAARQLGSQAGSMGYGVPAAVAASLLYPQRLVLCFVGDGGFMMTAQELCTAVQYGATPIVLVFNNGMYGTIRMHQERDHPGRPIATNLINPDFAEMARSMGCHGETVEHTHEFAPAFERAAASKKPTVIELRMDPDVISPAFKLSEMHAKAVQSVTSQ